MIDLTKFETVEQVERALDSIDNRLILGRRLASGSHGKGVLLIKAIHNYSKKLIRRAEMKHDDNLIDDHIFEIVMDAVKNEDLKEPERFEFDDAIYLNAAILGRKVKSEIGVSSKRFYRCLRESNAKIVRSRRTGIHQDKRYIRFAKKSK